MKDYEVGALIDKQDLHRLIDDPQNSYVQNAVWAANRRRDKTILRAANGCATEQPDTSSVGEGGIWRRSWTKCENGRIDLDIQTVWQNYRP